MVCEVGCGQLLSAGSVVQTCVVCKKRGALVEFMGLRHDVWRGRTVLRGADRGQGLRVRATYTNLDLGGWVLACGGPSRPPATTAVDIAYLNAWSNHPKSTRFEITAVSLPLLHGSFEDIGQP